MIHTYTAYCPKEKGKNLGWAYNNFMEMVPDDDWVLFLDHDAMFTTPDWYHQIEEIVTIADKPGSKVGLLTACSNRIGNVEQILFDKDSKEAKNHDMYFHRTIGLSKQKTFRTQLTQAKNLISGIILLLPKRVWKEVGGFKDGFLSVDNDIDTKVRSFGYKTYIMTGVYCYHWYRAAPKVGELQGWGYPISTNLPTIM